MNPSDPEFYDFGHVHKGCRIPIIGAVTFDTQLEADAFQEACHQKWPEGRFRVKNLISFYGYPQHGVGRV